MCCEEGFVVRNTRKTEYWRDGSAISVSVAEAIKQNPAARFERRADLNAIACGYGSGLKAYRAWLYNHVPAEKLAEKRRDYFSPEEIDAILAGTAQYPDLLDYWLRHVPMSLADVDAVR